MALLNEFKLFADYNQLMNQRLYDAAAQLSEQNLRDDRGAFFGSVLATLNHIMVGDIIWLKRFATHQGSVEVLLPVTQMPQPEKLTSIVHDDLAELRSEREQLDRLIVDWVAGVDLVTEPEYLEQMLYSGLPIPPSSLNIPDLLGKQSDEN